MAKKSRVGETNPTHYRAFTTASADVDLTTVSGCPPWEAERVEAVVTAGGSLSIKGPLDGSATAVLTLTANVLRRVDAPVNTVLAATTTATNLVAYWWWDGVTPLNP